jgi:serine protease
MRKSSRDLLACLVISLMASACGGGGGGGGSAASTPTDPEPPTATFTLTGTITTAASQSADSDTNDPTRLAVSNDSPEQAQRIPNPITLGGYINQPRTGEDGRSRVSGDIDDYFLVDLLAGQRVTLLVADSEQADADLYLTDTLGTVLDFSVTDGEVDSLLVPADGTYLVNVAADLGATNYILAIGAPSAPAHYSPVEHSIVPWQAVVTYKDEVLNNAKSSPHEDITQRLGLEQRAGGRGRGRLMALQRRLATAHQIDARLGSAARKFHTIDDPDLHARWETLMTIKSLRKDPRVHFAEPNYRVSALAVPNDQAYPLQWHYPLIGLPDAWNTTTGDPGVVVAVVDTGILANHPDLAGQLVSGYDFVRNPDSARDGDGIDPNPQDPGNSLGGGSESFHGTHVSGTVAARGNNQLGVAGVAYTSRIMPVRALGTGGSGTSYDVDQAVRFAAGLPNDSGTLPQQPADIINLSLGGAPFSEATQNLYDQVRAAGILVVAAAGNKAGASPGYPASYQGVIAVSAVDAQRRLAPYSSTGSTIDVTAPGGNNSVDLNGDGYPDGILSTGGTISGNSVNYGYPFLNGTSMAAPHVAGVLALMKSVNPNLTPSDIDALLMTGALSDDLGTPGKDIQFGHGIINAQRSILAALESTGNFPADTPRLAASSSTLNFGSSSTTLALALRNDGKGDLQLLDLSVSQPWLQIAPVNVDAAGLGEYSVTVDRENLSPGIYAAEITVQSSVNSLAVQVLVSAGSTDAVRDVGVIYILLYDPLLNEPVAQRTTGSNGTNYPFRFTDIPAGEYEIVAGTDADNDLIICDAGEACGAWLTIDQPIRFKLDSDVTNLDFPVEYLVSLPSINSTEQPAAVKSRRRAVED